MCGCACVGVCMCGCACGCYMPLLTQSGVSALMIEVAGRCRMEVVEELVKAGANLNLQDNVCLNIYILPSITTTQIAYLLLMVVNFDIYKLLPVSYGSP